LDHGKFYCKKSCAPQSITPVSEQKKAKTEKQEPIQKVLKDQAKTSLTPILLPIVLLSLTIGFGGVTFGLIEMRKNRDMQEKVYSYKESRSRLVQLVKKRNAYIKTLREELHLLKNGSIPATVEMKAGLQPDNYAGPAYRYSRDVLPNSFDMGSTDKKLIALTFDGGSFANISIDILDTLKSRHVKATMFVTGEFIRKHSDIVKLIVSNGHEVGNHTATHPHLTSWVETRKQETLPSMTADVLRNELFTANRIFRKLTGTDMPPFWRAPYGEKNREICQWAQQAGYLHIGWKQARLWKHNFDTNDWVPDPETPGYYTPQETFEKFMTLADMQPYGMNGAIILMHLGTIRKKKEQQVHLVLGSIIDALRAKGYEFVPISVLLKESNVDVSLLAEREIVE
jgi:peptidoglycan/xylan/chitin deacetylase (PgdA/CDA1 family)